MYSDIIGFYHGLPYGYAQSAISDEPFILIGGYVLWLKPFLKGLEHEPFAHVGTIQPDGTITGQIYHQVDGSFTGYAAFPKL